MGTIESSRASLLARFDEGEINFRPTYKFDTGTNNYDSSDKQRAPAWTDRVLWCSKKNALKCVMYTCERNVVTSDHKPVKALFEYSPPAMQRAT